MNSTALLIDNSNPSVCVLTLNRPKVHNAFDEQLLAELNQALDTIKHNDTIRLVQLRATGKHFSAGADLRWMQKMIDYSFEENLADANAFSSVLQSLNTLHKPTIAIVQGCVYGGGLGLLACCDIVVATDTSRYCFSETQLGLAPAVISPFVIKAIGLRHARRFFLTAELFSAAQAQNMGLISEVYAEKDIELHVDALCKKLLSTAPHASVATKNLLHELDGLSSEKAQHAFTAELIARLRTTEEAQDRLKAFLEKRQ